MGMRVLVDTNVLLDYLTDREPYGVSARKVVMACKDGKADGCIAAHSIPNMFFILRKVYDSKERREVLQNICTLFEVEGIDKDKILSALKNEDFSDFEDCLQMECALSFGAECIVTRNPKDFKNSKVVCIAPEDFVKKIDGNAIS